MGGTFAHYELHEFIAGQDYPPRRLADNEMYITRNGIYAALAGAVQNALPAIKAGVAPKIPDPSLQGRIAYLSARVKFVSSYMQVLVF